MVKRRRVVVGEEPESEPDVEADVGTSDAESDADEDMDEQYDGNTRDDDDEEDDEDDDEEQKEHKAGAGMPDMFSKILNQHVTVEEAPILAKDKGVFLEIQQQKDDQYKRKIANREKKLKAEIGHVDPSFYSYEREKKLLKVATKGAATLFNAVSAQQRALDGEKEKKSVSKMSKSGFLDMLKSTSKKTDAADDGEEDDKEEGTTKAKGWKVLEDDYLMSAKQNDREEEESDGPQEEVTGYESSSDEEDA